MRPLLRNALWLGFAAACGAAGLWFGFDYGNSMQAEISASLWGRSMASGALGRVSMAIEVLSLDAQGPNVSYADANLREALFDLGAAAGAAKAGYGCTTSDREHLVYAGAWLAGHPGKPDAIRDRVIADGLAFCRGS